MGRLDGRVAIVAGGATGIGAETARRLASEGATVVVGDIDGEGAETTAAAITDAGDRAVARRFDLGDEASIADLIRFGVEELGALHLLHVNGADTSESTVRNDTDPVAVDLALWDHVLRINLRGYLLCLRHAIPRILDAGGGSIVCTASDGGLLAFPNLVAYNASKAGVMSLVRNVAARYGKDGIRCNAVSPGLILTGKSQPQPWHDAWVARALSPRAGESADIAACVAYLLSDDAAFVNGQVISVNGGFAVSATS